MAATDRSEHPASRRRGGTKRIALSAYGEPMVWLTGGALILCLLMIVGLLALIVWQGLVTFWPRAVVRVATYDDKVLMGEVTRQEWYEPEDAEWEKLLARLPEEAAAEAKRLRSEHDGRLQRKLFRVGNFEFTGHHFAWVDTVNVRERSEDKWATVVERLEWGRFYGYPEAYAFVHPIDAAEIARQRREPLDAQRREAREAAKAKAEEIEIEEGAAIEYLVERREAGSRIEKLVAPDALKDTDTVIGVAQVWRERRSAWAHYQKHHDDVRDLWRERRRIEKVDIGKYHTAQTEARLDLKEVELDEKPPAAWVEAWHKVQQAKRLDREITANLDHYLHLVEEHYGTPSVRYERARKTRAAELEAAKQAVEEAEARLQEAEDRFGSPTPRFLDALAVYQEDLAASRAGTGKLLERIEELEAEMSRHLLEMSTAREHMKLLSLADIVRAYPANQLGLGGKGAIFAGRWVEFLTDDPREANNEGGVWPAIIGTVTMTMLMSLAVVPFGVLAALYIREYARAGLVVSIVRIAINNLAGVPSIVFGVFGLGFFCYLMGAYIDGGPANIGISPWQHPRWWGLFTAAVLLGVAAFFLGIFAAVRMPTRGSRAKRIVVGVSIVLWFLTVVAIVLLLVYSPYFNGFYRARVAENRPTFGKGGLVWASLTLALLTAPVVIVATEEALSAVPNSMREGSYACGASKWQTIHRIVLPRALPGIMTGMILAIARGAGEVAPLMLTGAVKLAPALPVDTQAPFVHLQRSFMHLGFHIYDLGFQSPNAEAAKPMVYSTTLLLIAIIAVLNIAAVWLRTRLRRKYVAAQF